MKPIEPFPKRDFTTTDILASLFFSVISFQICMPVVLLAVFQPDYIFKVFLIIFPGSALAISICFLYYQRHHRLEKKELEKGKEEIQLRYSQRLIDMSASLNREFRNKLTVLSLMADDSINGKTIKDYISSVCAEIVYLYYTGVENPVISSAILYHNIIAKEKGITILINTNTTLIDSTLDLNLLEQIIDNCFGLIVENEITSKSFAKIVHADITDTGQECILNFCNSEEAILTFKSCRLMLFKRPISLEFRREGVEKFKPVAKLVEKLGAMYDLKTYGGFAADLSIWIKKEPDKTVSWKERESNAR
jgi:sensor histidine kinase regulating citrate/malate metabolism